MMPLEFEYDDPIIHARRTGSSGSNPYVSITEPLVVDNNGKVILTEIPNESDRVSVDGDNRTWVEIRSGVPGENEYIVNYLGRTVTFNKSYIGKQLSFTYKGTGLTYISDKSIYVDRDGLEVTETLHSLTESTKQARDDAIVATEDTVEAIKSANIATNNTVNAINNANKLVEDTSYIEPYSNTNEYKKNNIVSFNGASFIAKQTTIGSPPPSNPLEETENEYWGLLARKGADGDGTVHTHKDEFVATEGQREFELSYPYDQFQNRTTVYINGVYQKTPENYEETTDRIITVNVELSEGDEVEVRYFSEAQPLQSDIQTSVDNQTEILSSHNVRLNDHDERLTNKAPLQPGGRFEWRYNSSHDSLDLVVIDE